MLARGIWLLIAVVCCFAQEPGSGGGALSSGFAGRVGDPAALGVEEAAIEERFRHYRIIRGGLYDLTGLLRGTSGEVDPAFRRYAVGGSVLEVLEEGVVVSDASRGAVFVRNYPVEGVEKGESVSAFGLPAGSFVYTNESGKRTTVPEYDAGRPYDPRKQPFATVIRVTATGEVWSALPEEVRRLYVPKQLEKRGESTGLPLAKLSAVHAVFLGLVEGLTEFLPISSTGHLIIATDFLDLNSTQPLFDAEGQPLWYRKPTASSSGELLSLSLATQAYIVVIQAGAIAAIIPICWSQLVAMMRGLIGRDPKGLRLLINVGIAFLPSALIGLLIHDWIDSNLYSIGAVIFALVAGAMLMFYADRWRQYREEQGAREITEISMAGAAGIGFLQCLAMWPGTSRPMMTIVGGYLAGLKPAPAAGFSFLLGFVTLSAAVGYQSFKRGPLIIQVFGWETVLLGAAVAAATAAVSVRFFVKLLLRSGLGPFAWYRLALAGFLAFLFY